MKTPQVPAMPGMSPLGFKEPRQASNEKTVAERKSASLRLSPKNNAISAYSAMTQSRLTC